MPPFLHTRMQKSSRRSPSALAGHCRLLRHSCDRLFQALQPAAEWSLCRFRRSKPHAATVSCHVTLSHRSTRRPAGRLLTCRPSRRAAKRFLVQPPFFLRRPPPLPSPAIHHHPPPSPSHRHPIASTVIPSAAASPASLGTRGPFFRAAHRFVGPPSSDAPFSRFFSLLSLSSFPSFVVLLVSSFHRPPPPAISCTRPRPPTSARTSRTCTSTTRTSRDSLRSRGPRSRLA